ncbi:MAG: carbohydrate ABC transporter substrate-binding protein [Spirochaetaceae bacterium]|nr:MAG: carbohydrate ABC transporter substrate-binding protein [Spirochaetaceae bacterium]
MRRLLFGIATLFLCSAMLFAGGGREQAPVDVDVEIDLSSIDLPEQFLWPEDELGPQPLFPEYAGQTIRMTLHSFSGTQAPFLRVFAENFNQLFPHFEVIIDVQQVPFAEMHDRLATALIAGTGAPDLFTPHIGIGAARFFQAPYADQFREIQLPEPLQGRVARTSQYTDSDGRLLGIENAGAQPGFLYYRADIFEEAGVEMPISTWDEYVAAGERIQAETGHYLTSFGFEGATEVAYLYSLAILQGNTLWSGDDFILNDARTLEALEAMVDLVQRGLAYDGSFAEEVVINRKVGAVQEGQIASFIGPDWIFNARVRDFVTEPNWRMQPVPRLPNAVADYFTWGGTGLSVVESQTDYPELAEAYVIYTLSSGNQIYKFEEWGHLPINELTLADPIIATHMQPAYFGDQVIGELYVDAVQNMASFEVGNGFPAVNEQFLATFNEALRDPAGWLQRLEAYWRDATR